MASAVITGSITTATEADIQAGGKEIVITLTDDTWVNPLNDTAKGEMRETRPSEVHGWGSDDGGFFAWNVTVVGALSNDDIVRTSDTVVTITLPPVALYGITDGEDETIDFIIPVSATAGEDLILTDSFTITVAAAEEATPPRRGGYTSTGRGRGRTSSNQGKTRFVVDGKRFYETDANMARLLREREAQQQRPQQVVVTPPPRRRVLDIRRPQRPVRVR